jgi:2-methylcitrate dehydratase PrpD
VVTQESPTAAPNSATAGAEVTASTDQTAGRAIAVEIADFAAHLSWEDIPEDVVERATLYILDSIGLAYASTRYDFAKRALAGVTSLGGGTHPIIAHRHQVSMRDAALLNGILIHGLDYDDTHLPGVVHATASAFPAALAVAAERHQSGRELLMGYILGLEVAARLGMVARGGFHSIGFHPTGLVGAFGAAVAAGRLAGLPVGGITTAQGIVGSMAGGLFEFLDSGAWTKRMHPGWAATCGITAAALAREGFEAPERIYEGRFGLYNTHLRPDAGRDLGLATAGLGRTWETRRVAVKPFPACHLAHAFADAAVTIARQEQLSASDIASVHCLIADGVVETVCEPAENKKRPQSDYDAKFSLPYIVAAALLRRRFTLAELERDSLTDPAILDLAARVSYETDPDSAFPHYYSGEVIVRTRDGRQLRHREQVNRGADKRPLTAEDIEQKFRENMALVAHDQVTSRILRAVRSLPSCQDATAFARTLSQ